MNKSEILSDFIEVKMIDDASFSWIKETLTRIGIASVKAQALYQSCHILHCQGRYYIPHFLEMFKLDGKPSNFTEEDRARRNNIAFLLEEWGLLKIINPDKIRDLRAPMNTIKIVSFKDKANWNLCSKYTVGNG